MAVNPVSGKVYVSNTDAHNDVRFEGHNAGFTTVRGNIVDSRITVIDPAAGSVTPRNLNSHLDSHAATARGDASLSRAFPQDLAVSRRRQDALRRRAGLGQARHLRHRRARGGHRDADARRTRSRSSAGGPTGVVARREATAARSCSRASTTASRSSTSVAQREIGAHRRCSTPSRRASPPAASTSTTRTHLGARRSGVRELPHRRRQRRPRVGPRQPGRLPLPITRRSRPASGIHTHSARRSLAAALRRCSCIDYIFAANSRSRVR